MADKAPPSAGFDHSGITRGQQFKKYQHDPKYHASCASFAQTIENRYSIAHFYGAEFERQKSKTITSFLRQSQAALTDSTIIDLGCHRGRIANLWAELKGESKGVFGTDFIPQFIETARRINPSITFLQHDLYHPLPFDDASFDFMSVIYVYNSIPLTDAPLISSQLLKKLKPGGYIILLDFYDSWTVRLRQSLVTLLRRLAGKPLKAYLPRLNKTKIKHLFPDCTIVAERKFMNMWSYPLLKAGNLVHDICDLFLPGEYYTVMLKKNTLEP
jgi:SAM-dependent methyltransferase